MANQSEIRRPAASLPAGSLRNFMMQSALLRTLVFTFGGAMVGLAFGMGFGVLASFFQGGPNWFAGGMGSAAFFGPCFAVGGLVLSVENFGTARR